MKMYEKLGIDLTTQEGFTKLISISCNDIPDGKDYKSCPYVNYTSCEKCLSERLFADIPSKKVKRWETYNGDFRKALSDWQNTKCHSNLKECAVNCFECFANWLEEEVEVE